jgi:hypothetical protein
LYPRTPLASGVAMKRVPTQMASAVEDPACCHHRHQVADRVDDLGDQRERGHLSGMATGLGALGHHEVTAGLDRPPGMGHLAAHTDDDHVVAVAQFDHFGRHAEAGHEGGGTAFNDQLHLRHHAARHGGEEVDPERLVGGAPDGGHFVDHLVVAHGRGTEASEPTGGRDRRHQLGVRHAAHAGQHDGVLYAEQVG